MASLNAACVAGSGARPEPLPPVQRDAQGNPAPPVARQEVFVVKSPHGDRVDEYYWLRDDHPKAKRADVMNHLRAEQAYTEAMLERLQPLQDALLREIRARIQEDDTTAPQHDRGWWYWVAYRTGQEHPVYMRRQGGVSGPERAAPERLENHVSVWANRRGVLGRGQHQHRRA